MERKSFSVGNFVAQGLNYDLPAVDLPFGFITSGSNFRISKGAYEAVFGAYAISNSVGSFNVGHIFEYLKEELTAYIIACGRQKVQVFDGSTWYDLTSAAGYAALTAGQEYDWNHCMLGKIPIINNKYHVPEYWNPQSTSQVMQALKFDASNTWAAKSYKCKVIRSHGSMLFALNMNESSVKMPDTYRWSHPADINGLPYTWDETDLAAIAGKASLGGHTGEILDGLTLRDGFVIYSENAINILYPDSLFTFRRQVVTDNVGILATNCVVEVNGVHFFISKDDFCIFDGSQVKSIAENRIRSSFVDKTNFNYKDRAHIFSDPVYKEVWFCIPSNGATQANIAYVYNWEDNTWAVRSIPSDTARICMGFRFAPSATWATMAGSWDASPDPWSKELFLLRLPTLVANSTAILATLDDPIFAVDSESIIERQNIPVEGIIGVTTITRIFPKVNGAGRFYIKFGSHDRIGSPVRWKSEVLFNPETQRSIALRTTGELHAYSIRSTGSGKWSFSGMDIEYSLAGER